MGTFRPGIGTGGSCIPLSSEYVLAGAEKPGELSLLSESIATDDQMPEIVAGIFEEMGCKSVGIMGISYKGDLKVPRVSRSAQIGLLLKEKGIKVAIHDPYFSAAEIEELWGMDRFDFPDQVDEFDGLLLGSDHREYTTVHWDTLFGKLPDCRVIIDNLGSWSDVDFKRHDIHYVQPGAKDWLNTPVEVDKILATIDK